MVKNLPANAGYARDAGSIPGSPCPHISNAIQYLSQGYFKGFPGGSDGKESAAMQETWVQSLGWEDPLEKGMATHSSTLA